MSKLTSDAIILNTIDYSESDKIACTLTKDHGIISAIAKGAKRSKKRFPGTLEPFSEVTLIYSFQEGRDLMRIESANLKSANLGIREDLNLLAHASVLTEVIIALLGPHDPSPEVYNYLRDALSYMDKHKQWFSVWSISMINLLKALGYGIDLSAVLTAQAGMNPWHNISSNLKVNENQWPSLSPEALTFIKKGVGVEYSVLTRMIVSPQARIEIERFLFMLSNRISGKPLKSVTFLAKLLDLSLEQW
ncbi:MAG: DNA repair protein RecO [Deltaproteobacteria bacterium]|nr:DNA repair protein RecO [Deltaproteobacteria bacterium]